MIYDINTKIRDELVIKTESYIQYYIPRKSITSTLVNGGIQFLINMKFVWSVNDAIDEHSYE